MFFEVASHVYGAPLQLFAFVAASALLDAFSVALSCINFIW